MYLPTKKNKISSKNNLIFFSISHSYYVDIIKCYINIIYKNSIE